MFNITSVRNPETLVKALASTSQNAMQLYDSAQHVSDGHVEALEADLSEFKSVQMTELGRVQD